LCWIPDKPLATNKPIAKKVPGRFLDLALVAPWIDCVNISIMARGKERRAVSISVDGSIALVALDVKQKQSVLHSV
jgi:hypothetical protein